MGHGAKRIALSGLFLLHRLRIRQPPAWEREGLCAVDAALANSPALPGLLFVPVFYKLMDDSFFWFHNRKMLGPGKECS